MEMLLKLCLSRSLQRSIMPAAGIIVSGNINNHLKGEKLWEDI